MATVSLKRQQYGELISPETIDGVAKAIAENFHPEKIILFGSYASGNPTPDSDLDFLVVMDSDQPRNKRSSSLQLMFQAYPCAMDILVYTPDEVNKWNGVINHIVTIAHKTGSVLYDRNAKMLKSLLSSQQKYITSSSKSSASYDHRHHGTRS